MKVIEAWTEQGEYLVCDGRCYKPRDNGSVVCRCLCQGMNHAALWRVAVQRTRANAARWIEERNAELPDNNKIVKWTVAWAVTDRLIPAYQWHSETFVAQTKPKNKPNYRYVRKTGNAKS